MEKEIRSVEPPVKERKGRRAKRVASKAVGLALTAALTACGPNAISTISPNESGPYSTSQSAPSFHTTGTRIYDAHGKEFIPYGVSVVDDLDQYHGLHRRDEHATDAQILAAADYWHVNSIRLQVSEDVFVNNVTPGKDYNAPAMGRLKQEIDTIENLGMVPIINDCTLFTDSSQNNPTYATLKFWNIFTNYFASQKDSKKYSNVILDIYNEPKRQPKGNAGWELWQRGDGLRYVGEQEVVDEIRGEHNYLSKNLIMVEGPYTASTLSQLDRYPIRGSNIVFAYHHMKLNQPATWKEDMGLNLKTKEPIIDGEWAQYASPTRSECYDDAPVMVPRYLKLLKDNHIGLVLWSLQEGVSTDKDRLATDTLNSTFPTDPAALAPANSFGKNYGCNYASIGHGGGSKIKQYFAENSRPS